MIGYQLSEEQYNEVQGKFITPYLFINCVRDINDIPFFFATEEDKQLFQDTKYMWLFDCPQGEYIPKPSPPFPNETN